MKPIADISYWQGLNYNDSPDESGVDFETLISKTSGVIARAGHGMGEDLRFKQYAAGLGSHLCGAYWYVLEDADPVHQAEAFADVIDGVEFTPVDLLHEYKLPVLWLDAEDNSAGKTKAFMADHYGLFLGHLETLRPDLAGSIGIYTRASFWNWNVGNAGYEWRFPLWVAHYGTDTPAIPNGWDHHFLHQYSADGNRLGHEYGVKSYDIDLNRINPELEADTPVEPPPVEIVTPKMLVTRRVLVRALPSTSAAKVGALTVNQVVDVEEIYVQHAAAVWVKHQFGWSAVTYYGWRFMQGL